MTRSEQGLTQKRAARRNWHRLCAVIVSVGLMFGSAATAAIPVAPVEAAWVDTEFTQGSLAAGTVPVPVIVKCEAQNRGLLGAFSGLTFTWTSTVADKTRMELIFTPNGGTPKLVPTSDVTQSGPVAGIYTYSVTYSSSLLSSLLGGLLGAQTHITISTRLGTNWVPSSIPKRTLTIGILGGLLGTGSCS